MIRGVSIPWSEGAYAKSQLHALGLRGAAHEASKTIAGPDRLPPRKDTSNSSDPAAETIYKTHMALRENQVALFKGGAVDAYTAVYLENPHDPLLQPKLASRNNEPPRYISLVATEPWRVDISSEDTRARAYAENNRRPTELL